MGRDEEAGGGRQFEASGEKNAARSQINFFQLGT